MEEWVGQVWHRLVTKAAQTNFPDAEVKLEDVRRAVAIMFRALGGDGGLRVESATESDHGARRSFLNRIAGGNQTVELAWRDDETLRLPSTISIFNDSELNRQLFLWLAALVAFNTNPKGDWLEQNSGAAAAVLKSYPGLKVRYFALANAHINQRPDPDSLPEIEAECERLIRHALLHPGAGDSLPEGSSKNPDPVPLWLHPQPPRLVAVSPIDEDGEDELDGNHSEEVETEKRKKGERVASPDGKSGLLAFRLESLFTRAEFAAVDRPTEEDLDNNSKDALEDIDVLSMARDRNRVASRLRFDLDLPPEENDDIYLGEGLPLPEWDYAQQILLPDHCRLQSMVARNAAPIELPSRLRHKARKIRAMFEAIKPQRVWHNAQLDGSELDTNALIHNATDKLRGQSDSGIALYRNFRNSDRDLSCLLLADLSLSTDAHVDDEQRVIEVIRDSLFLFSEALAATGDRFSMYGFSSRRRSHVRLHTLKEFSEGLTPTVRGRIAAIKPGYYTRMGAAIRRSSQILQAEPSTQKLMLILTDGKPNDLDKYEGRYGVEDTRMAIRDAVKEGIQPFCVTIDKKAGDYLPYIFGSQSYLLVRNARELPAKLPALYARLTSF